MSAIQSIAREAQRSSAKLKESLKLLGEQKTHLRDTIKDVRDGVTAKKKGQQVSGLFGESYASPAFGSQADSSFVDRNAATLFPGVVYQGSRPMRKEQKQQNQENSAVSTHIRQDFMSYSLNSEKDN